jgi:hypothetical protein
MSKFKSSYYYNQAGVYDSYTSSYTSGGKKNKKYYISYSASLTNVNIMFLVLSSASPIYSCNDWTLIALKRSIYGSQKYLQIFYKYKTNEVPNSSEEITSVFDCGIVISLKYYQYFLINTGQEALKTVTTNSIFGDKNLVIAVSHYRTDVTCSEQQIIDIKQSNASFGVSLLDKPKSIIVTSKKTSENVLLFSIGLI